MNDSEEIEVIDPEMMPSMDLNEMAEAETLSKVLAPVGLSEAHMTVSETFISKVHGLLGQKGIEVEDYGIRKTYGGKFDETIRLKIGELTVSVSVT